LQRKKQETEAVY